MLSRRGQKGPQGHMLVADEAPQGALVRRASSVPDDARTDEAPTFGIALRELWRGLIDGMGVAGAVMPPVVAMA